MIALISAIGNNRVIGLENKLIWHIPTDLARFKEITSNHSILMGRKTFESLPKMLPKRHHIIVSRNKDYTHSHITIKNKDRVEVISDIVSFLEKHKDTDEIIYVIGGGEIYDIAINYASLLFLTHINAFCDGDTFFPIIDDSFKVTNKSELFTDIIDGVEISYNFTDYKRER